MAVAIPQQESLLVYIRNGVVSASQYVRNGLKIADNIIANSEQLPSKI